MMAIVAVMMVVGFSAFKLADTLNDDPESGWYEISIKPMADDYDDYDEQLILDHLEEEPSGLCDPQTILTEPCAVFLDFSNYNGPGLTVGTTVADVLADLAQIDEDGANNDDGYARKNP